MGHRERRDIAAHEHKGRLPQRHLPRIAGEDVQSL